MVLIQLLMRSGAAQRMEGLSGTIITPTALNANDKNYTGGLCHAAGLLYDTVLRPSNVQGHPSSVK